MNKNIYKKGRVIALRNKLIKSFNVEQIKKDKNNNITDISFRYADEKHQNQTGITKSKLTLIEIYENGIVFTFDDKKTSCTIKYKNCNSIQFNLSSFIFFTEHSPRLEFEFSSTNHDYSIIHKMIEYIGETAKTHNCKLIYSYKTTNTKISTNKPLDTMIDESLTLKKDIIMEPGNFVGSIALFIFGIVAFIYKINNDNNNTLLLIFSLAFIGVGGILFFMSILSDDGLKVFVIIFVIFIAILAISSFISNSSRISRENEKWSEVDTVYDGYRTDDGYYYYDKGSHQMEKTWKGINNNVPDYKDQPKAK